MLKMDQMWLFKSGRDKMSFFEKCNLIMFLEMKRGGFNGKASMVDQTKWFKISTFYM